MAELACLDPVKHTLCSWKNSRENSQITNDDIFSRFYVICFTDFSFNAGPFLEQSESPQINSLNCCIVHFKMHCRLKRGTVAMIALGFNLALAIQAQGPNRANCFKQGDFKQLPSLKGSLTRDFGLFQKSVSPGP